MSEETWQPFFELFGSVAEQRAHYEALQRQQWDELSQRAERKRQEAEKETERKRVQDEENLEVFRQAAWRGALEHWKKIKPRLEASDVKDLLDFAEHLGIHDLQSVADEVVRIISEKG
jgi:hypothetical protein